MLTYFVENQVGNVFLPNFLDNYVGNVFLLKIR